MNRKRPKTGLYIQGIVQHLQGYTLGVYSRRKNGRSYPVKFQKFKKASTEHQHIPLISIDDIGDRENAGFRDQ